MCSIEAGLAELRNELSGQIQSLALAEETRGRARADELQREINDIAARVGALHTAEATEFALGAWVATTTMRAELIGHFKACMTEIYLPIDARMSEYIRTHH